MDSLTFLEQVAKLPVQPVYVLHGNEEFLKLQVLTALRRHVLESEENAFGFSSYTGASVTFAAVRDELETLPFVGPRRLVLLDEADKFVSESRAQLEKYLAEPSRTGVLVLKVKLWQSTTKLAKLLDRTGHIVCDALKDKDLPDWCSQWAAAHYQKKLPFAAARLLVDLVCPEMGLLDQELAKLAIYVGSAKQIDKVDVDTLVGHSRAEDIWQIFTAIGNGDVGAALTILDRLFEQGAEAIGTLGAFSKELRRLVQIARLNEQGVPLSVALEQLRIPFFAKQSTELRLKHLGRRRLNQIYAWLVEADLGLKGSSQLPPRTLLERLVVRLARQRMKDEG
jgi:DNA polymerase-3 subunit delta